MKPYLLLYNLASAVGWAYIVYITFTSLAEGHSAEQLYARVGDALFWVQSAALLEVVHSMIKMVKSPLGTTIMQVSSRLLLVWGFSSKFVECQKHWSLYLMVGSWALVEVPRYMFYAFNLYMKKVPGPLFFLRYNLFMVLYPTGISGEYLQMYNALPIIAAASPALHKAVIAILILYIPGGPFMIASMFGQRVRASKKRNPRKPPTTGLLWPITDAKKGERSTTVTGKAIWAASVDKVAPEVAEGIRKVRNWRFGYVKHVVKNVEVCARDTASCIEVCKAGLEKAYQMFQVVDEDGSARTLADEMAQNRTDTFKTGFIQGEGTLPKGPLKIPYKGKELSGAELEAQVDDWVSYGTIEPSAGEAIKAVSRNPEWLDLTDRYFVLLGAGSAMGPLLTLMALGANIIAVDLDRDFIWKRLLKIARNSPGRMYFPLKEEQGNKSDAELATIAGGNLFTHTARIRNWVSFVCPGKKLTIGGYAYLDGALHVQVSIAMDAIMAGVTENRGVDNVALAYLCSPTDVFANTDEAVQASLKNYKNAPLWQKLGERAGMLKKNVTRPVPSDGNTSISLVNGLVVPQGPNYALAKRLQHWRAMLSRARGQVVSTNIAPSTATKSVVHNASFAAAYGGMHKFKPMEIFYQETSNAVMGTLMLFDVTSTDSTAHPSQKLSNPVKLFQHGSFHGGIWRIGYSGGSIGVPSASYFYLKKYGLHLLAAIGGLGYLGRFLYTSTTPEQ